MDASFYMAMFFAEKNVGGTERTGGNFFSY